MYTPILVTKITSKRKGQEIGQKKVTAAMQIHKLTRPTDTPRSYQMADDLRNGS